MSARAEEPRDENGETKPPLVLVKGIVARFQRRRCSARLVAAALGLAVCAGSATILA